MSLIVLPASHLDHDLSPEHVAWLLARFSDRDGFFIESVTLPDDLGDVACGLHGPVVGDPPIAESVVSYVVRGGRCCASRVVDRPTRRTRILTVVAGPHDGHRCVLYTSYGGPQAPREPGDLSLSSWELVLDARRFWTEHALSRPSPA